jgi:hypothetical protein
MKKNILFFILAFCVIFLPALGLAKKSPKTENSAEMATQTEVKLEVKNETISNSKQFYTIKLAYPLIDDESRNATQFNKTVKNAIEDIKKHFIANVISLTETDTQKPPSSSKDNRLNLTFFVTENTANIISVRFDYETYFHGTPHPNQYFSTINYDLKQNRLISLNDLFKMETDFLQIIAMYCKDDLLRQQKMSSTDWLAFNIKDGTKPELLNYQHWNITKNGILIDFETYQVGPYVEGPQYVLVPFHVFKNLIDKNSIIGRVWHQNADGLSATRE